jgi:hypothetical protein
MQMLRIIELVYPSSKRYKAYALSIFVTIIMLSIAFSVMIASLNLQGFHIIRFPITHI